MLLVGVVVFRIEQIPPADPEAERHIWALYFQALDLVAERARRDVQTRGHLIKRCGPAFDHG